jgi:hypothetical protein
VLEGQETGEALLEGGQDAGWPLALEDDTHPGAGGVVEGGGEELGHGAGQGAHLVQDRGGDALQTGDAVGAEIQ